MSHRSVDIVEGFEALEGQEVRIAGRIMTRRVMGKASFLHMADRDGQIQSYVRKDAIGEESYDEFKHYDIGDIIGIAGVVFKTQKGEISVKAKEVVLVSKSLQILPEKYHGLKDTDTRYRQRYLDLIVNPEVKETFFKRSQIIKEIRTFLDNKEFLEVETPVLTAVPGGAAARPFDTHHNALDLPMHLRISLELPLKRLIVGGFERVYEIGRVFRNEGLSVRHNPEFTLLELYQAYTDYYGMMDITESLIRTVAEKVLGKTTVDYDGIEIDLGKPFERLTMVDAIRKYADIDFDMIETDEDARALAKEKNVEIEKHFKKGEIINAFFEEFAEEHLIQPTSSWIIRLRFHLLPRESLKIRLIRSVSSSSSPAVSSPMHSRSSTILSIREAVSSIRKNFVQPVMRKRIKSMRTFLWRLSMVCPNRWTGNRY